MMVGALCVPITTLAMAAIVSTRDTAGQAVSRSSEHWQRVELPPGYDQGGVTSQITIAIETKGQRLSGRIRIPGGIASNFATANGKAIVDLLNVRSNQTAFAVITAVEIEFTEATANQPITITTIAYQTR